MQPINEGQRVPRATFHLQQDGHWTQITSDQLFNGKTVVLFALPGAFTPTCSSTHLPRYNELAPQFRAHGVDTIACLSVNDCFVMDAWGSDQCASEVLLLPDGNGEFSRGMGLLVDKRDLGFGQRSWRYSMLVRDGVIEKLFIEPEKPGDPFEVSDADTMLNYIAPDAEVPPRITIFTKPGCGHCGRARGTLRAKGLHYEEVALGHGGMTLSTLAAVSGRTATPQVFIEGEHIGGADELEQWLETH